MSSSRQAVFYTLLLTLTIGLVYLWLTTPGFERYSLQAFAGATLFYFILKQRTHSKIWHLTPAQFSWEMSLATFALLLVVGATGGASSPLFPLNYVHLFFLVFASPVATSLITTGLIMLLFYQLDPEVAMSNLPSLISLPLMLIFFLFAKNQYDEVNRDRLLLEEEGAALDLAEKTLDQVEDQEIKLEEFVGTFLPTKIAQLKKLTDYAQENKKAILGQLTLIELEIEKVLKKVREGL